MTKKSLRWRGESDDIEDIIKLIETSYEIEFETTDFKNVETFGEFVDKIISKIKLQDTDESTYQQGFYKLRESIKKVNEERDLLIELNTKLRDLFPKRDRRRQILKIEKTLNIKLNAFRPAYFVSVINVVFFLLVAFLFFIDWKLGSFGLIISMSGFWIANKRAGVFIDNTLGELTERMIIYNYVKSRQNPMTVNKKEIEDKVKKLIIDNWGFKETDIGRETVIM